MLHHFSNYYFLSLTPSLRMSEESDTIFNCSDTWETTSMALVTVGQDPAQRLPWGPIPTACPARRHLQTESHLPSAGPHTLEFFQVWNPEEASPLLSTMISTGGISLNRCLHRSCSADTSRMPVPPKHVSSGTRSLPPEPALPSASKCPGLSALCHFSNSSTIPLPYFSDFLSWRRGMRPWCFTSLFLRVTWGRVRKITSAFGPAQAQWKNSSSKISTEAT